MLCDTERMWLARHKRLVAASVAVALLAGGAGALAATQLSSSNPRMAFIDDVASRLHVTPAALRSAIKQALIDRIHAARKAGGPIAPLFGPARFGPGRPGPGALGMLFRGPRFGPGRPGPGALGMLFRGPRFGPGNFGPRRGFGIGVPFGPLAFALGGSAVTKYLGIGGAKLRSDLLAGKSLAQIANATPGKSVAGLESALMAAAKTQLDSVVRAGYMTSTQEEKRLAALSRKLSMLVDRSFKLPGGGRWYGFRVP
jgi:hypothetical protein